MLLTVITSSTWESVIGERSGFEGANGTRGKPSIGVCDCTNSGDIYKDPRPSDRVRAKRGERGARGGGVEAM
jgi:hypothetical protein